MKKNMISIVILALMIVNVVLTAIMMFSVTGTAKKTSALVDNIATAMSLELAASDGSEAEKPSVPLSDIATYSISEKMTIPLKIELNADGKEELHYFISNITLSMNTKADGYKDYGEDLLNWENLIKAEIEKVIQSHTLSEVRNNQDQVREEILESIQRLFESEFIFNVSFSDTMTQ